MTKAHDEGISAGLCPRCAGTGRDPSGTALQCSKCMGHSGELFPEEMAAIDAALYPPACHVCGGDCSSANPPVSYCPMREAALAAPVDHPEVVGETHRHLKSGHLVEEVARGKAQVSSRPIEEMSPVAIYRHEGNWWVRHADEFDDGRFEAIDPLLDDTTDITNAPMPAALQPSDSPAPPPRSVAWLIERKFPAEGLSAAEPRWYAEFSWNRRLHFWTPTVSRAKRFASRAEAEAFPPYQMIASDPTISITEHVFLGSDSPALEAGVAEQLREALENVERYVAVAREDKERAQRLEGFAAWVETWVSNPVGAYSVSALDGLFGMTRDKIAALSIPAKEDGK